MTPAEIFSKTRRIEIRTSRLVNELFGGRYHSTFKGRGVEFSDVREYVPGDDIRSIHWNITARLGTPYIKRFTEERELTILIAVDVSASLLFGTRSKLKSELAAELVAILSFAALKNNDKVGLLLFSNKVENFIPPRKSKSHTLRMVRDALGFVPEGTGTNLNTALEYLNRVQKKRAVVFLISDFMDSNFEKRLATTRRRHDTIAFALEDHMEETWPDVGPILLEDAETGARGLAMSSKQFRSRFMLASSERRRMRDAMFSRVGMDRVVFKTDHDYVMPLLRFFQDRVKRLK